MRKKITRRHIETALAALLATAAAAIGLAGRDELPLGPKFLALEKVGRFKQPVHLAQPPGSDDLYVVEKAGRVMVLNRDGDRERRPFLDLRKSVKDDGKGGEQGMLAIAFAPDYPESRLCYVSYTDNRDALRVVEYRAAPGDQPRADPASARLLLRIPQPTTKHHAGMLAFGPDKYLYVGSGDGGPSGDPANVAQSKRLLLGKLLRINPRTLPPAPKGEGAAPQQVAKGEKQKDKGRKGESKKGKGSKGEEKEGKGKETQGKGKKGESPTSKRRRRKRAAAPPPAYTVPRDNPFVGRPGRDEIYSYGLRNPWRFSFDRATGNLAIGDVGDSRYEEINVLPARKALGANFGWSAFEGNYKLKRGVVPRARTVAPLLAYPHTPACAVTGGFVVRDPRLSRIAGREIVGRYIFGDYCTGRLFAFRITPKGRGKERSFRFKVPYLSSFGEDRAGRIYLISQRGPIYRLDTARKRSGT